MRAKSFSHTPARPTNFFFGARLYYISQAPCETHREKWPADDGFFTRYVLRALDAARKFFLWPGKFMNKDFE